MKSFRTIVIPQKPGFSIAHLNSMVSIGSCFSENIGKRFYDYKFNININPFGQQYNPHSIAQAIERLLKPALFTEDDLVLHNEQYHSLSHHGSFSKSIKRKVKTSCRRFKKGNRTLSHFRHCPCF
jgi:hypothetical protein